MQSNQGRKGDTVQECLERFLSVGQEFEDSIGTVDSAKGSPLGSNEFDQRSG